MTGYNPHRPNKYGNRKHEYNGRKYDSIKEANYAAELDLRLRAKEITAWEPQVRINLMANGQKICAYIMDFVVTYPDGRKELVEVKGFETDVWKLKKRMLEVLWLPINPGYTYSIIK